MRQIIDGYTSATVRVESGGAIGTGFVVSAPISQDGAIYYLVTAKHLLQNDEKVLNEDVWINFGTVDTNDADTVVRVCIKLQLPKSPNELQQLSLVDLHDLAIVRIPPSEIKTNKVKSAPVNSVYLAAKKFFENYSVGIGDNILVFGFPLGLNPGTHPFPFARKGIIASSPNHAFKGTETFLIDAGIHTGSSGSLVALDPTAMRSAGNPPRSHTVANTVGMISQVWVDEIGKFEHESKVVSVFGPTGLGVVVPSYVIRAELAALHDQWIRPSSTEELCRSLWPQHKDFLK